MVFHLELLKCMVLKTRPDRPIKLSANHGSSSVRSFRPESGRTRIKPVKPVVRSVNWTILSKPSGSFYFFFISPLSPSPPGRTSTPRWKSLLSPSPATGKALPSCRLPPTEPPPHLPLRTGSHPPPCKATHPFPALETPPPTWPAGTLFPFLLVPLLPSSRFFF